MIPFNRPSITDLEISHVTDALRRGHLSGDGYYTARCQEQIREILGLEHVLLTTSGTTALEMASLLSDFRPGDEVIVPSFTFSSTANAILLHKARPVFCDIRPDTLNMDETRIEALITPRTRAIYTVDYAGIPCEMDTIERIAREHGLLIIEDAAQSFGSFYKGRPAGTLGTFGCYSFHETKNYCMGEGGGLVINEPEKYMDRAEIIREKGTNRRQVLNGMTDKYTWHDIGSSFLPSDVLAAILCGQLERYQEIMDRRVAVWNRYMQGLTPLQEEGLLKLPTVPEGIVHNGHMFNIILPSAEIRTRLVDSLNRHQIKAYICYVPLHSAPYGRKIGYRPEDCPVTENLGGRVLRLPLFADLTEEEQQLVIERIGEILRA